MDKKLYVFINLSLLLVCVEAARILTMMPTPAHSHGSVFGRLTQELARRGHEVVSITAHPMSHEELTPANLTEINIQDICLTEAKKFWAEKKGYKGSFVSMVTYFISLYFGVEEQLKNEAIQKLLQNKSQHFDLIILEAAAIPTLVLSHFYKVPVIQVSCNGATTTNLETIGAPSHPFLYPIVIFQKIYNLTWWEKISRLYQLFSIQSVYKYYEKIYHVAGTPALSELKNNVHMLYLNVHPVWEGNHPVPPSVVHLGGGLHLKPDQELPEDLKSYLDSSEQGVIYMSFGTSMIPSLLPPEKIQMFARVFSQLPYDVLWKWDKDELPGRSNNIRIAKWLPQADLLKHPNVKLFITQGGPHSGDEAIAAGVPLVGIPMATDQWSNVERYSRLKVCFKLDFETIDEQQFKDAINAVLEDESYRRNMLTLRELVRSQRQSALERAVWWTEHVLRHAGATHLRAPAANMSNQEYFMLDIVVIVLFTFIICIFILCSLGRYLLNLLSEKLNN